MEETNEYPIILTVLNATLFVASIIVYQIYMASLFLTLMTWVSKLTELNKSAGPSEAFAFAKQCLGLYSGLEEGMGSFFFLWIFVAQIVWITMIFLATSMATEGLSKTLDVGNFSFVFVSGITIMIQATSFIFCLSDCHKSLEFLGDSLAYDILEMEPGRERQEAELLLKVGIKDHELFANM